MCKKLKKVNFLLAICFIVCYDNVQVGEAQGFPEQVFNLLPFGDYQMYYLSVDEHSKKLEMDQNELTGEYMPPEEEKLPEDLERMAIYQILGNEPMAFNSIVKESKMSHDRVASTLTKLELDGVVAQLPKKMFKQVREDYVVKPEAEKQEEVKHTISRDTAEKNFIHASVSELLTENKRNLSLNNVDSFKNGNFLVEATEKDEMDDKALFRILENFIGVELEIVKNEAIPITAHNVTLAKGVKDLSKSHTRRLRFCLKDWRDYTRFMNMEMPPKVEKGKEREAILERMEDGEAITPHRIGRDISLAPHVVGGILGKLRKEGLVEKVGVSFYRLKIDPSPDKEKGDSIKAKIYAGELAEVVADNPEGVGGYTAQISKRSPSFESEEHFVDHLMEITDGKIVITDQRNVELVNGEVFSIRFRLAGDTPTSICKVLMDTEMCDGVIPMDEYGVYTARVKASNPKFKGNNEFILWLSSVLADNISIQRSETDGSGESEVLSVTFKVDMKALSPEDMIAKVQEVADSVSFEDRVYTAFLKTEDMGLIDFRDSIKQLVGEHIVISEYRIKQGGTYVVKFTPKNEYVSPGEDTPKKKGRKPKAKNGQSKRKKVTTNTPQGDEKISTKEDRIPKGEPSRFQEICEDYDVKVGSRINRSIYRAGNDEASIILRYQRRESYWRLALVGANPEDFPGLDVTELRGHTAPHLDFADPKAEEFLRKHIENNFLVK